MKYAVRDDMRGWRAIDDESQLLPGEHAADAPPEEIDDTEEPQ